MGLGVRGRVAGRIAAFVKPHRQPPDLAALAPRQVNVPGFAGQLVQPAHDPADGALGPRPVGRGRAAQAAPAQAARAPSWRRRRVVPASASRAAADEFHQERDQADRALRILDLAAGGQVLQRAAGLQLRRSCRPEALRTRSGSRCRRAAATSLRIEIVASAKKVSGFSVSSVTVPTLTPAKPHIRADA